MGWTIIQGHMFIKFMKQANFRKDAVYQGYVVIVW